MTQACVMCVAPLRLHVTVDVLHCGVVPARYFEANGHGTVLFHESLLARLHALDTAGRWQARLGPRGLGC